MVAIVEIDTSWRMTCSPSPCPPDGCGGCRGIQSTQVSHEFGLGRWTRRRTTQNARGFLVAAHARGQAQE
jgi:hypothetical protein